MFASFMRHACIAVLFLSTVAARSLDATDLSLENVWSSNPYLVGFVGVAGILCIVVAVFGCAEICQRDDGFKDFENDDVFSTEVVTPPPQASEFTMYPPVESTPDAVSASPIVFEPLPDPIQLKSRSTHAPNATKLRPKVALVTRDRADSEDSLEETTQQDNVQDKLKLHNLLANSRNQIPRSQLQYIKELGNGWFGKVLQGEGQKILPGHKKTKVVIAMLREDSDATDQLAFLQEAVPYRDIDHPNVLRLLGQCIDTHPYLSVLELCPFGDVKTYLRSHRIAMESFNEKGLLLKFACDMAAGLQALHQQGYTHRDFATRNCLLASDLSVKIGDYGISEETFKEDYYTDPHGNAIPVRWLGPETMHITEGGGVAIKYITRDSNIWSFGITLWEIIMFGTLPYSDLSNEHVLRLVVKERSLKPNKPDMPVSHLDRVYQLMQLCWSEPGSRPSLRELRIMLLHLMSNKLNAESSSFDLKWNQLMPRRPPQVAKVAPQPQMPPIIETNGNVLQKGISKRPEGFENDFTELNPALLGQTAGLVTEVDIPAVHTEKSPFNELSLEAEFSAANLNDSHEEGGKSLSDELLESSKTESAANELSLAQELSSALPPSSPSGSEMGDDIIEIHTPGHSKPGKENFAFTKEEEEKDDANMPTPSVQVQVTAAPNTPSIQLPETAQVTSPDMGQLGSPQGDFATSTPKKETPPDLSVGDQSLPSSFYETALTSQVSTEEEPSILGQRKFAACLQTVVTSFDGEEFDPLSASAGDSSLEDVFKQPQPSIPEVEEPPALPSDGEAEEKAHDATITELDLTEADRPTNVTQPQLDAFGAVDFAAVLETPKVGGGDIIGEVNASPLLGGENKAQEDSFMGNGNVPSETEKLKEGQGDLLGLE